MNPTHTPINHLKVGECAARSRPTPGGPDRQDRIKLGLERKKRDVLKLANQWSLIECWGGPQSSRVSNRTTHPQHRVRSERPPTTPATPEPPTNARLRRSTAMHPHRPTGTDSGSTRTRRRRARPGRHATAALVAIATAAARRHRLLKRTRRSLDDGPHPARAGSADPTPRGEHQSSSRIATESAPIGRRFSPRTRSTHGSHAVTQTKTTSRSGNSRNVNAKAGRAAHTTGWTKKRDGAGRQTSRRNGRLPRDSTQPLNHH